MNDLLQGFQVLNTTIAGELKHPDYERVTSLADEYYNIFTGSGIEPYLRKYRKNEEEDSFRQMLDIYETTIPSVVHNIDTIFEKPLRSNRIFQSIDHESSTARDEILDRMKTFWQGEVESGLDAYMKERWKHLVTYDPNAFIVIEFSDFNPVKEKTRPFAIEYSSKQAINYAYIKGVLDWIIFEIPISYMVKTGDKFESKEGSKFIMYLENQAIVYIEVDPKSRITDIPNPEFVEVRKDPNSQVPDRVFVLQTFDLKSTKVPAFRVGYLQDPQSVSIPRTCLSNIHYALAFFKKELKSGVELDLTIRAHVFPKTFMFGPRCPGDKENGQICNHGKTINGGLCDICHGSGVLPTHTTSTDVIVVPWPKDDKSGVVNLKEAFAQFSPDMDLVRFMVEYCDRLTEKAKGAVFPSQAVATSKNVMSSAGGNGSNPTTATEQDYSWDNVYDAYRPFTGKYSYAWLFITKMIAIYTDNLAGFENYHSFPSDYKLKPIGALTTEATNAKTAGLPQHVMEAIYDDIANVYYADDQDTLTKINIKNKFHPFSGKSETEIAAVLMSDIILPYYNVLYTYFDIIFDAIDEELGDKFYLMTYEKQKAEIDRRVNEILSQVDKQKAKNFKDAQQQLLNEPNNPANPANG